MGLSYTKSNIEFTFSDLSLPLSVYLNIEHSTLCSVAFVHLMLQNGYPQLLQSTLVLVDNLLKQWRHCGFDFVHGPDNIKIFLTTTTLFWGCFKYIHFCTTLSKLLLIWFLSEVVKSRYSNVRLWVTRLCIWVLQTATQFGLVLSKIKKISFIFPPLLYGLRDSFLVKDHFFLHLIRYKIFYCSLIF